MTWRFATWNLDWWGRLPATVSRASVLHRFAATAVALQEVRGAEAKALRKHHPGPSSFSQELHPGAHWGWMGCGVLLAPGSVVLDAGVVEGLPKPQRSLWVRAEVPDGVEITVVSWHAPNAAGDGRDAKMAAFSAMSDWLEGAPHPMVVGADLNTWTDPVDLRAADPDDVWFHEREFVGPAPRHGLRDAYRVVLERSGELARLREVRPDGPLERSHVLRGGAEHRMDRIYTSADLDPVAGGYEYEAAVQAGSDHALHWIDLQARTARC